MRRTLINTVSIVALLTGLAGHAAAETTAEDAFKYRQSVMTALKGHVGAISMMVRGLAGDSSYLPRHAEALSALSGELKTVFQEGSIVEDSEALPVIWEEPEEFAEAIAKVKTATAALGDVATGGDMQAIGGAFKEVAQACKGCHERFRVEHD
jgi:cytochrome c556